MFRRVLGPEHPDTMRCIGGVAMLRHYQGRYDEARSLYIEALRIAGHVLGDEHSETLRLTSNLAQVYMDQGRSGEAEPLLGRAAEAAQRVMPGLYHGIFLANHGRCLMKLKRYDEAERRLIAARDTLAAAIGERNDRTFAAIRDLAQLYDESNQPAKAARCRAHLPAPATSPAD